MNENRNIKSPGLDLLASAKRKVVRTSQIRLESVAPALQDSVIYADTDMRLYFDASESRAKHVTELSLYTSERAEKKFTEIEAASDEVASSLLVSKMDVKAVAAKIGKKPSSGFLSGLTLWQSVEKLVNIGEKTGIMQLEAHGISLATGNYVDMLLRPGTTGLHNVLSGYISNYLFCRSNVFYVCLISQNRKSLKDVVEG